MDLEAIGNSLGQVRDAVGQVVVGYDDVVTDLLTGLIARGHVLLEGVPGVAKTTLAKTFAEATGLSFNRVQFTQDLLPADITGHYFFDQASDSFEVRRGPVFANVVLADEINRAPPKTQSALLEAMEEHQVTIEGDTFELPTPFVTIATMNPVDVEGVYRLPEAQLDRFMLRTRMGYLDDEQEQAMLRRQARQANGQHQGIVDPATIQAAREAFERVHVGDAVVGYIQEIGEATRRCDAIELGASPRAMEHALDAARARALLAGRSYVVPDDVQEVASRVLAHRLILDVDAEMEGITAEAELARILDETEVPKGLDEATRPDPDPGPGAPGPSRGLGDAGGRDAPGPGSPGPRADAGPSPAGPPRGPGPTPSDADEGPDEGEAASSEDGPEGSAGDLDPSAADPEPTASAADPAHAGAGDLLDGLAPIEELDPEARVRDRTQRTVEVGEDRRIVEEVHHRRVETDGRTVERTVRTREVEPAGAPEPPGDASETANPETSPGGPAEDARSAQIHATSEAAPDPDGEPATRPARLARGRARPTGATAGLVGGGSRPARALTPTASPRRIDPGEADRPLGRPAREPGEEPVPEGPTATPPEGEGADRVRFDVLNRVDLT